MLFRSIEAFHRRQLPQAVGWTDGAGVRLGWRWTPVDSVGLYVPGGRAAYPSSVLMNAIPARVAGVKRLAMVVPTPGGEIDPLVLAAAGIAGPGGRGEMVVEPDEVEGRSDPGNTRDQMQPADEQVRPVE